MKKLVFSCCILFLSIIANAQCPLGDLVLSSQADIDNFPVNYPSCTSTPYSITIDGGDISNVFALSSLRSIAGNLIIKNTTSLYKLQGLHFLMNIEGEFRIENNSVLISISRLKEIDASLLTSLVIMGNPNLKTCSLPVICNFVADNPGIALIQDNNEGCNNEEEILSSCSSLCPSVDISLKSQEDIDNFKILYPNCRVLAKAIAVGSTRNSITSLAGLSQIVWAKGNFIVGNNFYETDLIDLAGLENLKRIDGDLLITFNRNLKSLDGLESLKRIGKNLRLGREIGEDIGNPLLNNISALNNLELIGGDIRCVNNNSLLNFSGLNNLTLLGGGLVIQSNQNLVNISALNSLNNLTIEGDVNIRWNSSLANLSGFSNIKSFKGDLILDGNSTLTLLGLNSVESIGGTLNISYSDILIDLENLNSLTTVNKIVIRHNSELVNLNGLDAVNSIYESLWITDNDELLNIRGISNANLDEGANTLLYIRNNSKLSVCNEPNVCRYLNYGGRKSIGNNLLGCNSFEEVIAGCSAYFNTITGGIRFDIDNDGCENTYALVSNLLFQSTDGVDTYGTFSNSNGGYEVYVPEGTFNTIPVLNNSNFSVSPVSQDSNFADVGNTDILNTYCVVPEVSINDAIITILPLTEARPGFDADYKLVVQNVGTNSLSGSIVFQFDDAMQTFVSSSIAPLSQESYQLTFEYNSLAPFNSLEIDLTMNTLSPPTVNDDDLLNFIATIKPTVGDATSDNNIYDFKQIVINSFDPNDKNVLQGEEIPIGEIDNYLDYIIRFQNTGSASAINVRIKDELVDNLDWSTFSPISMSHSGTIQISNGKDIEFIFEGINLPDNTSDEEGSKGYVAFKIKPKSNVQVGDIVTGEANIYFDYNLPITTNSINTEIVKNSLSTNKNKLEDSFLISPNPTKDVIYISTKLGIDIEKVKVYSVSGKLLLEINNQDVKEVDLKPFPKGLYFLNIVSDKGSVTKKIIKN